jgi:ATP-dependent Clp protease adaptor protein ClpS
MVKPKTINENKGNESISPFRELVLHNDDFNTFDFVIKSLIEVCRHDKEQAEQCAMIVHYNGRCVVKTATFIEIEPMYAELLNRNLTVTIE